jgi:hypothetical protein
LKIDKFGEKVPNFREIYEAN